MKLPIDMGDFSTYQIAGTVIVASILLFILHVRRRYTYWKSQGVPGPAPLFLMGNTFDGFGQPLHVTNFKNFQKYGPVYGVYNGLVPSLICGDPEMLRNICVKDFHAIPQSFNVVYLHPVERNFLINIHGPKWKRIRSLVTPTFSSGKLKKMFELMKFCITDAMSELEKMSTEDGSFNPKIFWGRYNMDLIARCCFAVSFKAKDENDPLLRNFIEFFQGSPLKLLAIVTLPEWIVKLFRISLFPGKNLDFLRKLTLQLIENRKQAKNEAFNDFLQLLIDSRADVEADENGTQNDIHSTDPPKQNRLTSEEIVSASVIFLVAGYETTSTLLTWVCYRLALNPDIQEKLYQEIISTNIANYDDLISLQYLDAVLNETMRIDPPVAMFQRVPHHNYPVPGHDFVIPKGSLITIPTYSIHHDPKNYPNPELFDPDRFLPQNKELIKPFAFVPFGAGPRICIGMRFSLINAKLSLATLLTKFRLVKISETLEKPEYGLGTILLTTDKLRIGLERRD
ncbi:cytochrome P450 3A7-like [Brevipalpus obovatus]|uniref:cytochrome P450 3A7-like n=1 Tax=Brevipalpus obovatus TaxID=246614 RepID=UPI003D9F9FB2